MQHTIRKAEVGEIGARELASVAHGAACCGLLGLLFAALAMAAERRVSDLKPLEFANTTWAFWPLDSPEIKGGGVHDLQIFLIDFPQGFSRNPPGSYPVASQPLEPVASATPLPFYGEFVLG